MRGPSPVTTKVTLCASCSAELPFKAQHCPSCGAAREEEKVAPAAAPPTAPAVGTAAGFRFRLGFAAGALIIAALAWLGFNALQGADGGITFGSPMASTFEGSGSATSEPVRLGGEIDVDWTARPNSPAGCRMRAVLQVASNPNEREVLVDGETITEATGTHVLYGLIDNDYVIDVASNCDWSFRLKPRS